MTNENMIKQLKRLIPSLQYADDVNAVKGAIKALSQEPCEAISRDWLKTAIHNFYYGLKHTPSEEDIQAYIDAAPSVSYELGQKIEPLEVEAAKLQQAYNKGFEDCRQAAIDAMYALCDTGETLEKNPWRDNPHIDAITDAIEDLPSVTQKCEKCAMNGSGSKYCDNCGQKSGKWILTIEDWNKWTCSKCGYVKRTDIHVNIGWNYCPNCGSAMKGE